MTGDVQAPVPTAWLIRAGRQGEREEFAIENSVCGGGWGGLPNLTAVSSRLDLERILRGLSPDWSNHTVGNYVGQFWMLRNQVRVGDLVVMPLKTTSRIALGAVTRPYWYRGDPDPDKRHVVSVDWKRTDVPRTAVRQDLLNSLGSARTICTITRNDGAWRLHQLLLTGHDPGPRGAFGDAVEAPESPTDSSRSHDGTGLRDDDPTDSAASGVGRKQLHRDGIQDPVVKPSNRVTAPRTRGRAVSPTVYRDTGYTLMYLIEEIRHGKIALPDIQRPFVWSAAQVRDLFDSMYRGYPVGTLMFWETGADASVRQVGGGENDGVARLLIVDGQQRLTSLFAVLTGSPVRTSRYQQKQIRIAFRPEDETFEVTDAAIERDPEFIADMAVLWADRYRSTVRAFLDQLGSHRGATFDDGPGGWSDEQDILEERIDRVRDLRDFRFQVLELGASAHEEQVADIFVRTNSEGVQLKQSDFILTLMSVHWEKGRRQLEQFCRAAVDTAVTGPSPKNAFIEPGPDQLLRVGVGLTFRRGRLSHVYNILRGKDLETGEVSEARRTAQFEALAHAQDEVLDLSNWHEFLKCLTHAGFRSGRMVTSQNALIYAYMLWLIGRCDFGLDLKTLRGVIARWFFMSQTTGRYTGSYESQIEADLGRLAALAGDGGQAFCDELDRLVQATFTNDYWDISLPNRLDTSAARSPVLSAYQAALNLLDAEALFSDLRIRDLLDPAVTAPRSVDRHHLFPKAHLAAKGITGVRHVNAIANMAYLDWPDNAHISADDPLTYWPAMTRGLDPDQLHRQIYWHALPVGWEQLEYTTFLERRRTLLAQVVRDGFSTLWEDSAPEPAEGVTELLRVGESQTVEFKSTARWNLHAGKPDKKMEHVITKTVCGFLNAQGGKLLIGVDDDGNVVGLDSDLQTLRKGNSDGYELFLRQLLDDSLSVPTAGIVRISFESVAGENICVVSASSSGKPVFAKPHEGGSDHSEFWVRIGNTTKQLHGDDMLEYRTNHWGG